MRLRLRTRVGGLGLAMLVVCAAAPATSFAQGRGGGAGGRAGGPPPAAKAAAPEDITGTYVSVVSEHWHLRMFVPPKGDVTMLPVNAEARRVAGLWDPAKEPAGDEQCKGYGAA